jgi:hypothetical protein
MAAKANTISKAKTIAVIGGIIQACASGTEFVVALKACRRQPTDWTMRV